MMMAKRGVSTAVPRLRFPEFRHADAWAEKSLKEICTVNPPNNGLPDSFVYIDLESVEGGVLKSKSRVEKKSAPSRAQRLLRNGDVIFQVVRPYQRNNLFVRLNDDEASVASTGYAQLRAKNSEAFLYQLVHTDPFVGKVIAKCTGSNYPAINSADLAEVVLFAPDDTAEQQKIADCLTSLDEVIAAQGRKVKALQAHKRGLVQQLFPREGETRPRLRFPEFHKDNQSRFKSIGEFAKVTTGSKDTQNKIDNGQYPFFVRSQNVERIDSFSYDGEAVLTSGDGVGVGENYHYINGKFDFHQRVYVICDFDDDVCGQFFFYFFSVHFKKRVKQMSAKNSVDSVRMAMITEMPVWFPRLAEQQRIADGLSSLDTRIAAESNQLAALKNHKQGLMQQLFPAPEAV